MKKNKIAEKSILHKKNIKIHNNLWKVYALTLIVGILIILVKGFI